MPEAVGSDDGDLGTDTHYRVTGKRTCPLFTTLLQPVLS